VVDEGIQYVQIDAPNYGRFCDEADRQRMRESCIDPELERLLHLYCLNRGVLVTPFHNMMLTSPATTEAQVDRHTEAFESAVAELAEG